jgi:hypothetical protein
MCISENTVTISLFYRWKVSVAVLPVTMNCHNDLHDTKSLTQLSMNDKREVADLVQGTCWKSVNMDKLKHIPTYF